MARCFRRGSLRLLVAVHVTDPKTFWDFFPSVFVDFERSNSPEDYNHVKKLGKISQPCGIQGSSIQMDPCLDQLSRTKPYKNDPLTPGLIFNCLIVISSSTYQQFCSSSWSFGFHFTHFRSESHQPANQIQSPTTWRILTF